MDALPLSDRQIWDVKYRQYQAAWFKSDPWAVDMSETLDCGVVRAEWVITPDMDQPTRYIVLNFLERLMSQVPESFMYTEYVARTWVTVSADDARQCVQRCIDKTSLEDRQGVPYERLLATFFQPGGRYFANSVEVEFDTPMVICVAPKSVLAAFYT